LPIIDALCSLPVMARFPVIDRDGLGQRRS